MLTEPPLKCPGSFMTPWVGERERGKGSEGKKIQGSESVGNRVSCPDISQPGSLSRGRPQQSPGDSVPLSTWFTLRSGPPPLSPSARTGGPIHSAGGEEEGDTWRRLGRTGSAHQRPDGVLD